MPPGCIFLSHSLGAGLYPPSPRSAARKTGPERIATDTGCGSLHPDTRSKPGRSPGPKEAASQALPTWHRAPQKPPARRKKHTPPCHHLNMIYAGDPSLVIILQYFRPKEKPLFTFPGKRTVSVTLGTENSLLNVSYLFSEISHSLVRMSTELRIPKKSDFP